MRGPCSVLLGPEEELKIVKLSAGKPKESEPGMEIGVLNVGPDFMSDEIYVTTKDNIALKMGVTYKWELRLTTETVARPARRALLVRSWWSEVTGRDRQSTAGFECPPMSGCVAHRMAGEDHIRDRLLWRRLSQAASGYLQRRRQF